jgi:hypothetical protein
MQAVLPSSLQSPGQSRCYIESAWWRASIDENKYLETDSDDKEIKTCLAPIQISKSKSNSNHWQPNHKRASTTVLLRQMSSLSVVNAKSNRVGVGSPAR